MELLKANKEDGSVGELFDEIDINLDESSFFIIKLAEDSHFNKVRQKLSGIRKRIKTKLEKLFQLLKRL